MRAILSQAQSEIIRNRVYISRNIKVFTIETLAKEWEVPIPTLYRYISDDLRQKSREYARLSRQKNEKTNRSLCQICFEPLKSHLRCRICTQLTHEYSIHTHPLH